MSDIKKFDDKNWTCSACNNKVVNKKVNFGEIECSHCKLWYHGFCVNLKSKVEFSTASKNKLWFCPKCIGHSNLHQVAVDLVSKVKAVNNSDEIGQLIKNEMDKMFADVKNYASEYIKNELLVVNNQIADTNTRVISLEKRINNFERIQRSKNILIHGIPSNNNIHNLEFIISIGKEIGFNVCDSDIDNVFRFKNKSNGMPVVQVSFSSRIIKERFMYTYLKYSKNNKLWLSCIDGNSNSRVYLNNYLEKHIHQLLLFAKAKKKDEKLSKVSMTRGKVSVIANGDSTSKPIVVTSFKEIEDLILAADKPLLSSTITDTESVYNTITNDEPSDGVAFLDAVVTGEMVVSAD